MRRKLVLVNPVNPVRTGLTLNKSSRFPPIGLGIVAALTPEHWDVELVDENWESFASGRRIWSGLRLSPPRPGGPTRSLPPIESVGCRW